MAEHTVVQLAAPGLSGGWGLFLALAAVAAVATFCFLKWPRVLSFSLGVLLLLQGLLLFHAVIEVMPAALESERTNSTTVLTPCPRATPSPTPSANPTATPTPPAAQTPAPTPTATATPTSTASATPGPTGARPLPVRLLGNRVCWTVSSDSAVLLLVLTTGAIGALVHAATSFSKHHAKRTFDVSYHWWYLLRVLVGAGLSAIFYVVIRGGLLSITADDTAPNVYGIAAVAALAGLFSYPAMKRLEATFQRIGDPSSPSRQKPKILAVTPTPVTAGTAAVMVGITGKYFGDHPALEIAGVVRPYTAATDTKISVSLTLALTADELATAGALPVRVWANGEWSDPVEILVVAPEEPAAPPAPQPS